MKIKNTEKKVCLYLTYYWLILYIRLYYVQCYILYTTRTVKINKFQCYAMCILISVYLTKNFTRYNRY